MRLFSLHTKTRRQVLGGLSSKGLGMFLLLEQGMAAWMRACSATLAVPSNEYLQPAVPVTVVSDLHGEVVRILASMALGQTYSRSA